MGRAILIAAAIACAGWAPRQGTELIGTRAPELRGLTWIKGGPLTLSGLHGHPVLIRFWTNGCELCRGSASSLNELRRKYGPRGLVVIGVHHPKNDESKRPEVIRAAVKELGFTFPVATDPAWATLKAFGVGSHFTEFTSVTVLVGGDGVIRWVHDGGVLDLAEPAGQVLTTVLDRLTDGRQVPSR